MNSSHSKKFSQDKDSRKFVESSSSTLELSPELMKEMVDLSMEAIITHLQNLEHAPAQNMEGAHHDALQLKEDLPHHGTSFKDLLQDLFTNSIPRSINTAGPGYMGYIPGGGLFHSAVADLLANAVNRFVSIPQTAPFLTQIEMNTIRWLCTIMGYPTGAKGLLTSGGSHANFSAVVTARTHLLPENFLSGVIYTSDQAHQSVQKAARLAGFPQQQVRVLPSNSSLQIPLDLLEKTIVEDRKKGLLPFMLIGHGGTTNSGAIDPLEELAKIAAHYKLWLHVDAAYGGLFHLTQRGKKQLNKIHLANSITLDPHKSFFLPYGTGALLVRDSETLSQAFSSSGEYLPPDQQDQIWNFHNMSSELSRDFRGLRLWLPIKMHGIQAFQQTLDEKLDLTQWIYEEIKKTPNIEILHPPQLSLFAFRLSPKGIPLHEVNSLNQKLLETINHKKRIFLSGTMIQQKFYLRICVLSFRTHRRHVEMMLEDFQSSLAEWTISNGPFRL